MNYSNTFTFKDFILEGSHKYEFSDIDMTERRIPMEKDYFYFNGFSAKMG
jgi:hypothetical protein